LILKKKYSKIAIVFLKITLQIMVNKKLDLNSILNKQNSSLEVENNINIEEQKVEEIEQEPKKIKLSISDLSKEETIENKIEENPEVDDETIPVTDTSNFSVKNDSETDYEPIPVTDINEIYLE
jgi:cell division protein FtsL